MATSSSARRWDVLGMGANSVDYVYLLPGVPEVKGPGAKMRIREQRVSCGGQMVTALATCARFGLQAKYVGVTGTDPNGARVRAALAALAIECSDAIIRDARNQFAVIMVDAHSGERIVLWDRDERLALRPRELPLDLIPMARLLHLDDVDQSAAIELARAGRSAGLPVTSDIDRVTDRTGELFEAVTVPIVAEHIPAELTGERDPERALRKLRRRHDGVIVVTLGPQGAAALEGDRWHYVPGHRVHAVDTTGAGDVFRGGYIYGLLNGWDVERTLRFANAAAAVSCTRLGALDGVPELDAALALVEQGPMQEV